MVGTVLADLAATSAAINPAAVTSAHAHAAAAALLRMLRHTDVRQAVRAVLKAAEEDAQAMHSVQLTVLSGLLGTTSVSHLVTCDMYSATYPWRQAVRVLCVRQPERRPELQRRRMPVSM